jgi:6-phosphogluconolactonase
MKAVDWALVGARTTVERHARGRGLTLYRRTEADSAWAPTHTLALTNPSFQVVNRAGTCAYTVHGDGCEVSVIGLAPAGALALRQSTGTRGMNPVHLCLTDDERFLLVANYASGSLICLSVGADGLLGEPTDLLTFEGTPGPRSQDQKGSHPHQVVHWPGTPFFLVPDKGLDQLHVLRLGTSGQLARVFTYPTPPGSGPRHLAIDTRQKALWLCLELGSAVTRLGFDPGSGRVHAAPPEHSTSTLPTGHVGENSAAGIALHPSGHLLYVSNRGHDSVCVMTLDPNSGAPTARHWVHTLGHTPRFIGLTPDGNTLVVANEDTDTLVHFALDEKGQPGESLVLAHIGSPVCVSCFAHAST